MVHGPAHPNILFLVWPVTPIHQPQAHFNDVIHHAWLCLRSWEICPYFTKIIQSQNGTLGSIFMANGIPVTTTARPALSAKSRPSLTCKTTQRALLPSSKNQSSETITGIFVTFLKILGKSNRMPLHPLFECCIECWSTGCTNIIARVIRTEGQTLPRQTAKKTAPEEVGSLILAIKSCKGELEMST